IGEKLRNSTGAPAANENQETEEAPAIGEDAEMAAPDVAGPAHEPEAETGGDAPELFREEPQAVDEVPADEDAPQAEDAQDEAQGAEAGVEPEAGYEEESTPQPDTSILERLPVPLPIHSGDRLHYANPEFLTLTAYSSLAKLEEAGGLETLFAGP